MKIIFPYPVSANRYWRHISHPSTGRPITLVSKEAKAYREEVGWLARAAGCPAPVDYAIELRLRLVPKGGVCMDLDNALKVMIDALKGILFVDDAQVRKIIAERADGDGRARLEVEIRKFVPEPAPIFARSA
jgi:crossover junction endodeoxyribonuclease RusA